MASTSSPENPKCTGKPNLQVFYVEKELGGGFIRPQPSSCFPVPCHPHNLTAEAKDRPTGGGILGWQLVQEG